MLIFLLFAISLSFQKVITESIIKLIKFITYNRIY